MKRIWIQRIGAAVLCAVLLAGCMPGGPAADSTASADPLTGQEQQYPGQRPAAVVIDNAPGSTTRFAYDTDTGTYGMLHHDGSPQLDANTGIQAAFDNLLVLYSASTPRDDGRTLDYDLTMGGGLWLNGGHLWHITWTQGTGSTFAFYDADGRPLRILSGRSYIAWLSSLTGEEVIVQDSAGNDLLQP